MNQERLMQVLLAPQISEKATYVAEKHEQVIFRVVSDATKPEIKAAVELLFKVDGRRKGWKKAYVCLKSGQEINFVDGGNA